MLKLTKLICYQENCKGFVIISYMQKVIISVILFIFMLMLHSCDMSNPNYYDAGDLLLKSETKWLVNIDSESKLNKVSFKEYDTKGYLILDESYDDTGMLMVRRKSSYSSDIKYEEYVIYQNGQAIESKLNLYHFNSDGLVDYSVCQTASGDTVNITRFQYDERGNLIIESVFNSTGELIGKKNYKYIYNTDGLVISRHVRDDFLDRTYSKDSVIYDMNSSRVDRLTYNNDGLPEYVYTYIYNRSGVVQKEIVSNPTGKIVKKYVYEYLFY